MEHIETKNYIRVTKRAAEKLFNENKTIRIVPCNIHPEHPIGYDYDLKKNQECSDFSEIVSWFAYCHCDTWHGRYPAFYVRKEA